MDEVLSLPKNLEAEKAIISIVLNDQDKFVEVGDLLEVGDFYSLCHQEIWRAMKDLSKKGIDIDVVSLKTELKNQGIDSKPAMEEIGECYENPVFIGNFENFVKEVKNKSILREVIGVTNRYQAVAKDDEAEALSVLSGIEKDVVSLGEKIHDGRPVNTSGILGEVRVDISRGEQGGWKGYETGFKFLDDQTGGLLPTHCWIIGGYTGSAKTFFLLQVLLNVLKQGGKVVLFSTEMDRKMNMLRMLGNLAGLGTIRMLKGNIDEAERKQMMEAEKVLESYDKNLTIYDNVYSVEEIRLKAKKQKMRGGLDVVAVDFIQNLRGAENIYERMSNAAINLQKIAQELDITMIITSQVTQSAAGWSGKEAIEYKGAGEIAAIADVAIWIQRDKDDKSARKVILRKLRHGSPGWFQVRISFPSGKMIDMLEGEEGESAIYI